MSDIILIGTVHTDHKGPERLKKALNHYKPSIVCLETTPQAATEGWNFHQHLLERLENTPWDLIYSPEQTARARSEIMCSHYESWVPKVYKNSSSGVNLFCIDRPLTNDLCDSIDAADRLWLLKGLAQGKSLQDLLSPVDVDLKDFVENGSEEEYQKSIDAVYMNSSPTEFRFRYGQGLFEVCVLDRDRRFAEQIRKVHTEKPGRKIAAVLGNMHIFGQYSGSTYDLLKDLSPERIRLKDITDQL